MGRGHADIDEIPACGCQVPGVVDATTCYCGVEDLLRIIRRRYSLAVLRVVHHQAPVRYRDLASALPAASSSTLAETLRALTSARLVDRSASRDHTGTPEYRLTRSGERLLSRLRRLLDEVQS